jgi:hypothetical protein
MDIEFFPTDISKLCISYLSEDDIKYSDKNKWNTFPEEWVCRIAAQNGWLDLLIWAHHQGCVLTEWVCIGACENYDDSLEILEYLKSKNCKFDERMCFWAAGSGNLKVLQWLKLNGTKWDSMTCDHAARGGHLDLLKWAKDNGCDWNENTFLYALWGGDIDVIEYLKFNGCSSDSKENCAYAVYHKDPKSASKLIKWLEDNDCCKCTDKTKYHKI